MSPSLATLRNVSVKTVTEPSEIADVYRQILHHLPSRLRLNSRYTDVRMTIPDDTWGEEYFAISYRDQMVGYATTTVWRYERVGSMVLAIVPDAQKRGIGVFAGAILAKYLFEIIGIHKLETVAFGYNTESIRIQSRFMRLEGVLKESVYTCGKYHDKVLFGLTRREYRTLAQSLGWF